MLYTMYVIIVYCLRGKQKPLNVAHIEAPNTVMMGRFVCCTTHWVSAYHRNLPTRKLSDGVVITAPSNGFNP